MTAREGRAARRPVVLVVIKGLGLGGAERLISEAAAIWDQTRFDYRVAYFLPWKDQLVPEIVASGIPVTLLGKGRFGLGSVLRLRRLIAESGADVLHVHSPAAAVLTRLVTGKPVVYTEHNLADSYRQPTRILNRLTYGRNAKVIAVSEPVAQRLSGYPGPHPVVIENGVSCQVSDEEREQARQYLKIDAGRPLIVHVGNIRPYKGHRTLLAATKHIVYEHPEALVVSIGGEKHPGDLEKLQTETTEAGLDANLRFIGRRDDARSFLGAADVVVNPSDVEGLPVAVLEAMALARPIVATAVGGVPGLIVDGETGLLVPAGDPDLLASAVARLLDQPDLAAALGRQAEVTVSRDHGLAAMVRAVEQVYDEVLGG